MPTDDDHGPRRRRLAPSIVAVLVVASSLAACSGGHRTTAAARTAPARGKSERPGPTAQSLQLEAAPWRLPGPLSRAVALVDEGHLVIFGGLGPKNVTTRAVTEIDPQSGKVLSSSELAEPVHDAAGVVLGAKLLVFGGGAAKVSATVQGHTPAQAGAEVARLGALPAPRADLGAATVGDEAIVAGGYDGSAPSPDVLSTTDGATYTRVAQLAEPVRYPSVVVAGARVYVIGGEGAHGESTDVQVVDTATHAASVVGHLAHPISHAAAVDLGGRVYLVGGRAGGHATDAVEQVDLPNGTLHPAGRLPTAVSDAFVAPFGQTAYVLGGERDNGQPVDSVVLARLVDAPATTSGSRSAAGETQPFDGKLLIADRGNNRLILVGADKQVQWIFPSAQAPAPPEGFYFPDDAFFAKHGTAIITNEEEQHTIIEIAYPSGKVLASYGHPNRPGSAPGYLDQPDDAYLLADGRVTVADAKNCRIVVLNPDFSFRSAIGTQGRCRHDLPRDVAYPNGDTPLDDGNILVSEINGSYVDEVTPQGNVVWSVKLPLTYPSDPQQIGTDLYLVADYAKPGGLYEFTREGQITWSYVFQSGEQMLDHPSLVERLPTGLLCVNDDYRHRVAILDPGTKTIVWQYGQTDVAGTGPNQLNTPDGFDLLAPGGTTPTHPHTG